MAAKKALCHKGTTGRAGPPFALSVRGGGTKRQLRMVARFVFSLSSQALRSRYPKKNLAVAK
jgi:hypothetical protein